MRMSPQLRMVCHNLANLPSVELPLGYRLRHFSPGDARNWGLIIGESFGNEALVDGFDRIMRADVAYREQRVLFIERDGEAVATASAFIQPGFMAKAGMLHYVGVREGHRGRRLGYVVSLAAMHRMVVEGWTKAWLATDDFRLPALKTYLSLGYEPLLVDENQRERWRAIFDRLNQAQLTERYAAILSGDIYQEPHFHQDDYDYTTRNHLRLRRFPERRPARPQAMEVDSLADESLYRGSEYGRVVLEPNEVVAGDNLPFRLTFTVGPVGLAAETEVFFFVPGQRQMGTNPQNSDPNAPGYVEVATSANCRIESLPFGFKVGNSALREGDIVTLDVGKNSGFAWVPLAGRIEMKVVLTQSGEPSRRLPEPVVMRVVPEAAATVEVFLPATFRKGEVVEAKVSVRDRFDNRVDWDGEATLAANGATMSVPVVGGRGRTKLTPLANEVLTATAAVMGVAQEVANPCVPVGADDLQLFFGDLHLHDFNSPAAGNPMDVYGWARNEKRLDFASLSEQNHGNFDNEKWTMIKHMAEAFLDEGRFVTFPACEWQHSHYGDKIVHFMGGDQPYLPVDDVRTNSAAKLYEAARGSDAIIISHHPGYALDLHVPGTDWEAMENDIDRLVELWSCHGSSEGYDQADRPLVGARRTGGAMEGLRKGRRFGFVAGSDTHSGRPGGSVWEPRPYWGGLTAVWARELTRRGIFEALWARRTYALTKARIVLKFYVNGGMMGEELPPSEHAKVFVEVWAPGKIAAVEIMKNCRVLRRFTPNSNHCRLELEDETGGAAYYYGRVVLADGNLAVASPVWLG